MEFVWVRWYKIMESHRTGWGKRRLDRLEFPPIDEADSFGFIDPSDIMRSCHIIPAFASGIRHIDGRGLSFCAGDSSDWVSYYVNRYVLVVYINSLVELLHRFVDRDMLMRYHYGLGVGHIYAHSSPSMDTYQTNTLTLDAEEEDLIHPNEALAADPLGEGSDYDLDFPDESESNGEDGETDDDEFLFMYGP